MMAGPEPDSLQSKEVTHSGLGDARTSCSEGLGQFMSGIVELPFVREAIKSRPQVYNLTP